MIVFTNGCFDVLHTGHLFLLQYCRQLSDRHSLSDPGRVFVGINTDESTKRLKGPTRPVNKQADRRFHLLSLKYVDDVFFFEEDTPYQLIKRIKPHIIVKGGDYDPVSVVGSDLARVEIFNYIKGKSTTEFIEKVKKL